MENNEVVNTMKVEIYDLSKEVQSLRGFLGQVAGALKLEGESASLEGIGKAIQALIPAEEDAE